jgi:WD40 repeat protein
MFSNNNTFGNPQGGNTLFGGGGGGGGGFPGSNQNYNNNNLNQNVKDDTLTDLNVANPAHQPEDSVSSINWIPNQSFGNMFAAACWDGKIKLYSVAQSYNSASLNMVNMYQYKEPVLGITFIGDGSTLFAACGDNTVQAFDVQKNGPSRTVSLHNSPVRDCFWINEINMLVTGSFDKSI